MPRASQTSSIRMSLFKHLLRHNALCVRGDVLHDMITLATYLMTQSTTMTKILFHGSGDQKHAQWLQMME